MSCYERDKNIFGTSNAHTCWRATRRCILCANPVTAKCVISQIPLPPGAIAEHPKADEARGDKTRQIAPDLGYRQITIVNVIFFGLPGDTRWVLIDAGVAGSGPAIRAAARARFGQRSPAAIILTHGHFDHVGALETLAAKWDVPVYAHPLEHPRTLGWRPKVTLKEGLQATIAHFLLQSATSELAAMPRRTQPQRPPGRSRISLATQR